MNIEESNLGTWSYVSLYNGDKFLREAEYLEIDSNNRFRPDILIYAINLLIKESQIQKEPLDNLNFKRSVDSKKIIDHHV